MGQPRVASRYAKSLLGLALEKGQLEEVNTDMVMVSEVISENHDLKVLLRSPIVKTDKKLAIINAIFGDKMSVISKAFLEIITKKRREELMLDIADKFLFFYKENKGIKTAKVTTATPLDEASRKEVLAKVKLLTDADVELQEQVDEELIGGIVLRVDDNQYNASLKRMIKDMEREFDKNPYIKEY